MFSELNKRENRGLVGGGRSGGLIACNQNAQGEQAGENCDLRSSKFSGKVECFAGDSKGR